jgi:hypothetical protein
MTSDLFCLNPHVGETREQREAISIQLVDITISTKYLAIIPPYVFTILKHLLHGFGFILKNNFTV